MCPSKGLTPALTLTPRRGSTGLGLDIFKRSAFHSSPAATSRVQTRKVRRGYVAENYVAVIDAFYAGEHEVELASSVTYEDGRTANIKSHARIEDVEAREAVHV